VTAICVRVSDLFALLRLSTDIHTKFVTDKLRQKEVAEFARELSETASTAVESDSCAEPQILPVEAVSTTKTRKERITVRHRVRQNLGFTEPSKPSDQQAETKVQSISSLIIAKSVQAMLL
jgi:hypothetical protein